MATYVHQLYLDHIKGTNITSRTPYIGCSKKWSLEENKKFEDALALFDKDTPDRWYNVAAMIPGKSVSDVIKQYKELEEDVSDIEAGLITVPDYIYDSFTLESMNQRLDGMEQFYISCGKRSTSTRPSYQERRKGVAWTEEEHRQFLLGLKKYGKGDWRNISRNFVTSRTPTQVASHAQKYFIRQLSGGKDKRRSSIHDITTVNVRDAKSTSINNNQQQTLQCSDITARHKEHNGWNVLERGPFMSFNQSNSSLLTTPLYETSVCGLGMQACTLRRGSSQGPQFGYHNSFSQMQKPNMYDHIKPVGALF